MGVEKRRSAAKGKEYIAHPPLTSNTFAYSLMMDEQAIITASEVTKREKEVSNLGLGFLVVLHHHPIAPPVMVMVMVVDLLIIKKGMSR